MTLPANTNRRTKRTLCHLAWFRSFIKYGSRFALLLLVFRMVTMRSFETAYGSSASYDSQNAINADMSLSSSRAFEKREKTGYVVVVHYKEEDAFNENDKNNTTASFTATFFSSKPECQPLSPDQVSMTLTTQLSLDRMWIMKHQCDRWPGPISIAIDLPVSENDKDNAQDEKKVMQDLEMKLHCDLSRTTVTILKGRPSTSKFPINVLRNLAFEGVKTTHAAYVDSDFLISSDLHEYLMTTAAFLANDTKAAIVMPAFEYLSDCNYTEQESCREDDWKYIPKTQNDLLPLLQRKYERPRIQRGYQNKRGKNRFHGSTRYGKWSKNQTIPLQIHCIKDKAYEPYLAVRVCRDLPEFPPIFRGWGFNKVSKEKKLITALVDNAFDFICLLISLSTFPRLFGSYGCGKSLGIPYGKFHAVLFCIYHMRFRRRAKPKKRKTIVQLKWIVTCHGSEK